MLREWRREGLDPAASVERLPVSELAASERRTVAIDDLEVGAGARGARAPDRARLAGRRGDAGDRRRQDDRGLLRPPRDGAPLVVGRDRAPRGRRAGDRPGDHTGRLLAENRDRLDEQTALLDAAQVLTEDLDPDRVLERLVTEAVRLVGADAADCWILDGDDRTLRCRAVHGLPATEIGRRIAPEGTMGEALAGGRPLLRRRFAETERPPPSASYARFAEVMDAPISVGGRVRGVLGVCAERPGTFAERQLALLETFARLASLALRNAEVFAERARQVSRAARLLAGRVAARAAALAGADAGGGRPRRRGGARRLVRGRGGPRARRLTLAGGRDLPQSARRRALAGPRPRGSAGRVGRERTDPRRRPRSATTTASPSRSGSPRRLRARARCSPFPSCTGRAASRSCSCSSRTSVTLADDDLELAHHLAGAARGSLERSLVFEDERRARALAQQLARTASVLATELDPTAVLDEVVRQALPLVGVDAAAIRLVQDDELVLSAVEGLPEPDLLLGDRSPLDGLARRATWPSRGRRSRSRTPGRTSATPRPTRSCVKACARTPRSRSSAPRARCSACCRVYDAESRAWRVDEVEALTALAADASAALRTPSSTSAWRSRRSAASRSSPTSRTASWPSTATARSCSGTAPRRRSPASPPPRRSSRTPEQVLGRRLEGEGELTARDRLVSIVRGGDEIWLSVTEAVMRDPAGAVAGRIYAFRDISAERAGRGDEDRVRHDRVAGAPPAAHVDLRLRRDAAAARHQLRRGGAPHVPRLHRVRVGAADRDRRHAAQRRPPRRRRPPDHPRADGRRRRGRGRRGRPCEAAASNGHRFVARRAARSRWRPRPTPTSCARCSRTSSTTPSSTRRTAGRSRSPRAGRTTASRSRVADEGIGIPDGRAGADLPQVLPRRLRGRPRRPGRHRSRPLHRRAASSRRWAAGSGSGRAKGEGSSFAFELPLPRRRASEAAAERGITAHRSRSHDDERAGHRRRGADPPALPRQSRGGGDGRARGGRRAERARARRSARLRT